MSVKSEYYLHESDKAALEALEAIPGFSQLLKNFMKQWNERQSRLRNLSSFIRIGEDQLPEYDRMLDPICEKLGIEKPELYLMMDVRPNAFTSGETQPYIVLTSGLLDMMPKELIPSILAHECGHIACHHVLYRTMGSILIGTTAGTLNRLPLGGLISLPLQIAFFYWMRCSEYSADRAAMICDGSADRMVEVCMRLAGFGKNIAGELNREAFLEQAREYRSIVSDSRWDKTLEFYLLSGASHPFTALRALEATEWAASEQYRQILDGTYELNRMKEEGATVCPNCGAANPAGALFCDRCGTRLAEKKVCPNCGAELDGDEVFCPACGEKLK